MKIFFHNHHRILVLLLVGVFASVPLVTHAMSLGGMLISAVGFILWIGAKLLDAAVTHLIVGMGGLITGAGGSLGVGLGISIDLIWRTVRDLVNLTFIFGLVYVGFKTILNAGTDTKKLLASIIIGALLVNFSLFISKVVIDVSNVTASEIYKRMGVGANATGTQLAQFSISEQFMTRMGIMNLFSVPNAKGAVVEKVAGISIDAADTTLPFVIGASFFVLVAAFVFAAGAVLILIRFGTLVILMMLSPIAFAATVFPVFKGWSEKWWHTLFSQAFFAPAFLFMIFVTLKVADGYYGHMKTFDLIYDNQGGAPSRGFTTAIFFCLTIVMMVASLILAKQMGAYGGSRALSMGKKMRSYAVGSVTSFAGRNIIGRTSQGIGRVNARLDARLDRSQTGRFFKGAVGMATLGTLSERTRRNVLEAGQKAKFGGAYSRADDIAFSKEQKRRNAEEQRIVDARQAVRKGRKAAEAAEKRGGAPTADETAAITAFAKIMRERTDKEIENMKVNILSNEHVAFYLNSKQIEAIEKSDKFTPQDVATIKDARASALEKAAGRTFVRGTTSPTAFGDIQGPAVLARRGENELAKTPIKALLVPQMAEFLTPGILEQLMKEGRADNSQLQDLKTNIETWANTVGTTLPGPVLNAYVDKFDKWKKDSTYGASLGIIF